MKGFITQGIIFAVAALMAAGVALPLLKSEKETPQNLAGPSQVFDQDQVGLNASAGYVLQASSTGTAEFVATSTLGISGGGAVSFGDLTNVATSSDAAGDIYYLNESGQIVNLAKGIDGQVLKLSSGLPDWGTDNTGAGGGGGIATTSPFTTGDLVQVTDNGTVNSIATSSLGLLTTDVAEGTNLYYTVARVQSALIAGYNAIFGNATTTNMHVSGSLTANLTGNADTATALAANGANCASGNSPLGVDANGAVESCFDVWTEAENTAAAYLTNGDHWTLNATDLYYTGGNVGVGTSSPASKLDVWGNLTVGTSSTPLLSAKSDIGTVSINGYDQMIVNGVTISNGLQVHTTNGATSAEIEAHKHSDVAAGGSSIYGARSRGTEGAETAVQSGDRLLQITATGYDGTDYATAGAVRFDVDGTPGANDMPGRITFLTAADGGQALAERMRITNAGNVGIGTTTPANTLDVNGSVRFESLGGGLLTTAANGLLSVDTSTYLTTVDISDNTNLTVGATGIELSNDDIALTAGYNIPLIASTTEWATAYGWGDHSVAGYLTSVAPTDMNSADFGDFTCNGTTCSLDANTVDTNELVLSMTPTWTGQHTFTATTSLATTSVSAISSNILPSLNNTYNIGSASNYFANGYFGQVTVGGDFFGQNFNSLDGNSYVGLNTNSITLAPAVGDGDIIVDATNFYPISDGKSPLGSTTKAFSDLYLAANATLKINNTNILSDSAGTLTLLNIDALDATTESTIEAAIDTLSNLTSVGTITTGTWQATLASTSIGSAINAATAKTTPADADMFGLMDSAAANVLKKFSWANLKTAMQTFLEGANLAITGAWDFGGATVELPNGTNPTVDATGEVALDTTDNQLLVADSGGTARVYGRAETTLFSFALASTSADFVNGGIIDIAKNTKDGRDITQYRCHVDGGTSVVVNVSDGTNDTETITCGTTQTSDTDVATNSTFTADELWEVQIGAITGTPDYLIFEAYGYITRE